MNIGDRLKRHSDDPTVYDVFQTRQADTIVVQIQRSPDALGYSIENERLLNCQLGPVRTKASKTARRMVDVI